MPTEERTHTYRYCVAEGDAVFRMDPDGVYHLTVALPFSSRTDFHGKMKQWGSTNRWADVVDENSRIDIAPIADGVDRSLNITLGSKGKSKATAEPWMILTGYLRDDDDPSQIEYLRISENPEKEKTENYIGTIFVNVPESGIQTIEEAEATGQVQGLPGPTLTGPKSGK